jgi:hypothetical protein
MSNNNNHESSSTTDNRPRNNRNSNNRRNDEYDEYENRSRSHHSHHNHHHNHHNHSSNRNNRQQQQQQQRQQHGNTSPKSYEPQKADPIMTNRRKKLLSVCSTNSHTESCICCLHDFNTFVYYQCLHFVCLNCAIKMRVLCGKKDCPVCRQESKNVLCTKKPLKSSIINSQTEFEVMIRDRAVKAPKTEHIAPQPTQSQNSTENDQNQGVGIYFELAQNSSDDTALITEEYMDILANKCDICSEDPNVKNNAQFNTFKELDSHMRKIHKRFYCELCLEHSRLFPYERKHYTREELALHKRNGDKGDYSFKGHPLCKYYFENFT